MAGEQPCRKGPGVLMNSRLHICQQGDKCHPGVHQIQHNQTVNRGDCLLYFVLVRPHLDH